MQMAIHFRHLLDTSKRHGPSNESGHTCSAVCDDAHSAGIGGKPNNWYTRWTDGAQKPAPKSSSMLIHVIMDKLLCTFYENKAMLMFYNLNAAGYI